MRLRKVIDTLELRSDYLLRVTVPGCNGFERKVTELCALNVAMLILEQEFEKRVLEDAPLNIRRPHPQIDYLKQVASERFQARQMAPA